MTHIDLPLGSVLLPEIIKAIVPAFALSLFTEMDSQVKVPARDTLLSTRIPDA